MTDASHSMARRTLLAVLIACLLVIVGVVAERAIVAPFQRLGLNQPTATGAPASTHAARAMLLATTLEAEGIVEHRIAGNAWRPLGMGKTIGIDEEVRTGASSRARLQLGPHVSVELADNTAINIAQLSETLSRVLLQDGRVVSEVRAAEGFRFRVQVQGNNSQAETSGGRFGVLHRGGNPAAFAAEQGTVVVTGADKRVTLAEGEQTVVADNSAPSPPTKLPTSLLLKLGRPPPSRLRVRQAQVTGETSPGAVVTLGNSVVAPDERGQFKATVALVDGPNEIRVQVEDVVGRKQTAHVQTVTVDSSPPPVTGKVVW